MSAKRLHKLELANDNGDNLLPSLVRPLDDPRLSDCNHQLLPSCGGCKGYLSSVLTNLSPQEPRERRKRRWRSLGGVSKNSNYTPKTNKKTKVHIQAGSVPMLLCATYFSHLPIPATWPIYWVPVPLETRVGNAPNGRGDGHLSYKSAFSHCNLYEPFSIFFIFHLFTLLCPVVPTPAGASCSSFNHQR